MYEAMVRTLPTSHVAKVWGTRILSLLQLCEEARGKHQENVEHGPDIT